MGPGAGESDDGDAGAESVAAGSVPEDDAWAALRAAGRRWGVDVEGARLVRSGTNVVFRLPGRRVARVASRGAEVVARRSVAVARWLESVGFPAVRVVAGVDQPVAVGGCMVTLWRLVSQEERWAGVGQIGEVVRRLHWLEEPASLGLPLLEPLRETVRRLGSLRGLSDADREFLGARAEALGRRFGELEFVLPRGMVHGDASVGNVLLDDDGNPVVMDLDGFAVGPREWDLVLTALYFERFGWHTRSEYEAFVRGYGFDVMNWYGYPVLADMRELMMTVWLARKVPGDSEAAEEVQRRIHDLRTDGDRHGWRPF
ncbi:MAG: aminoglycoside phosphotransferase family protein [Actinomycetota bacterium]|nr:aminoglycoside phosphotransferase family protein [Actinomycetota bacterium]